MHHDHVDLPLDPDLDPADAGRRARPAVLAAVAGGGALGAAARRGMVEVLPSGAGRFPWGTFVTNLAGSFLLGLLLVIVMERSRRDGLLRPFAATGVLGAFTTMSAYQLEAALLARDGHVGTAAAYGLGSPLAGVCLAYLGIAAGRWARPPARARRGAGPA